ncbi:MAG: ATP-binding protein, partial [Planctomycetota bacterium]
LQKQSRFDYVRDQFPKAIEECRGGIDRVIDIVNAMKDFSHPGTREKLSMNLNKAIESTIAISRSRWKHAADLELDLDPELPSIDGYSSELNQVLLNLVVNAGDAIAEKVNEGEIGKIIVRSRHDSRSVSIIVEDNGGGIPESIRQKIFDPFFTTKEVGKGTGQGLAITHNVVVNMHGGAIDIDSHEGVGTAFTIQLPREAGLEQPSSNDNARVEPSDQMLMAT